MSAAAIVKDSSGEVAEVKFSAQPSYPPFNLGKDAAVVAHAKRSAESIGLKPTTVFSNGGLDANWLHRARFRQSRWRWAERCAYPKRILSSNLFAAAPLKGSMDSGE